MSATILDGRSIRDGILKDLKKKSEGQKISPTLAIIQIGNREDSNAYIAQKIKFADMVGAKVDLIRFDEKVTLETVSGKISELNQSPEVHGIIVQLPVPPSLDPQVLVEAVAPEKDVDGLTSTNLKLLWTNSGGGFVPATAKGIQTLLDHYQIPLRGKKITVIGRSVLVGKPAILTMLNRDATVTACHSQTCDLEDSTQTADILIAAIGKPKFITKEHVSPGQTVIDVGINLVSGKNFEEEIEGYTLVGDVDFESVKDIVGAITPVPGGIGPMTVASLYQNLFTAYENQSAGDR